MTSLPERSNPTARFPAAEGFPTGPDVGELLPDFSLPDQRGTVRRFHKARGDRRAVLIFIRATAW